MPEPMTETDTDLVVINGLRHCFSDAPALRLDHWRLAPLGHAVVTGPSGSGKTTLLQILAGLLIPTSGNVLVDGRNWQTLSATMRDRQRGRTVGIVFQSFHLIRAINVLDNLRIARRLAGRPDNESQCRKLLEDLGIAALANRRPTSLSHGETQRAAIARAVISDPALILADEPTSVLDADNAAAVVGLLRDQAVATGAGLVIATHDPRVADLFDRRLDLKLPA